MMNGFWFAASDWMVWITSFGYGILIGAIPFAVTQSAGYWHKVHKGTVPDFVALLLWALLATLVLWIAGGVVAGTVIPTVPAMTDWVVLASSFVGLLFGLVLFPKLFYRFFPNSYRWWKPSSVEWFRLFDGYSND